MCNFYDGHCGTVPDGLYKHLFSTLPIINYLLLLLIYCLMISLCPFFRKKGQSNKRNFSFITTVEANSVSFTYSTVSQRSTCFRYTIREQVLDDGLVSELSILQTYRQDTGALTCRASNAYGQDEMLIHLVVQEVQNPIIDYKRNKPYLPVFTNL